jgi:hypothetical protein
MSLVTGLFMLVEVAELPESKHKFCRGPERIGELDRNTFFMAQFKRVDRGNMHPYKLFAKCEKGKPECCLYVPYLLVISCKDLLQESRNTTCIIILRRSTTTKFVESRNLAKKTKMKAQGSTCNW